MGDQSFCWSPFRRVPCQEVVREEKTNRQSAVADVEAREQHSSSASLCPGKSLDPPAPGLNASVFGQGNDRDVECLGRYAQACGRPVRKAVLLQP